MPIHAEFPQSWHLTPQTVRGVSRIDANPQRGFALRCAFASLREAFFLKPSEHHRLARSAHCAGWCPPLAEAALLRHVRDLAGQGVGVFARQHFDPTGYLLAGFEAGEIGGKVVDVFVLQSSRHAVHDGGNASFTPEGFQLRG